MLYAVIMAGGSGTRFWPLSRNHLPKQFLTVFGERSLLQQTVDRLQGYVPADRVFVVTNHKHLAATAEQLPELPPEQIIGEPLGRDTAACIGLAAELIHRRDPGATMAVLAADHLISPPAAFQQGLAAAVSHVEAQPQTLVTFGIPPTRPATGYGYLHRGAAAGHYDGVSIHQLQAFVEKPSLEKAESYVASGDYFWNSGIFCWQAATILAQLAEFTPELKAAVERIAAGWDQPDQDAIFRREYEALPKVSIDYAVMERAPQVAMVQAPFAWDDVGSWLALERVLPADDEGNVVLGQHVGLRTAGCLVAGHSGHLVTTIGVEGLIIVTTPDATLVARRDDEQAVKQLLEELKRRGLESYL